MCAYTIHINTIIKQCNLQIEKLSVTPNLRKSREEIVGKDVAGVPRVTREHRRNRHVISAKMREPKDMGDRGPASCRVEI